MFQHNNLHTDLTAQDTGLMIGYVCSTLLLSCFLFVIIKPPLATARAASCIWPVPLFVCLSVCRQIAKNAILSKTMQFRAMVSIDDP